MNDNERMEKEKSVETHVMSKETGCEFKISNSDIKRTYMGKKPTGKMSFSLAMNLPDSKIGTVFIDESQITYQNRDSIVDINLQPVERYKVRFKNPDTNEYSYMQMTGEQIADGNGKFEAAFHEKFQKAVEMAALDDVKDRGNEKAYFTDGSDKYDKESFEDITGAALDRNDDIDYDYEDGQSDFEHDESAGYTAEKILEHEMNHYFGDMNVVEKQRLAKWASKSDGSVYTEDTRPEGRLGVILYEFGNMVNKGWMEDWLKKDGTQKEQPAVMPAKSAGSDKPVHSETTSTSGSKKAVVQIQTSNVKPFPKAPGRSFASVGLNSEHGIYGVIKFLDKSLKTSSKNPGVQLLYLSPDKEYKVGFRNKENKWSYEKMTGREISDGNKAYLKEAAMNMAHKMPSSAGKHTDLLQSRKEAEKSTERRLPYVPMDAPQDDIQFGE